MLKTYVSLNAVKITVFPSFTIWCRSSIDFNLSNPNGTLAFWSKTLSKAEGIDWTSTSLIFGIRQLSISTTDESIVTIFSSSSSESCLIIMSSSSSYVSLFRLPFFSLIFWTNFSRTPLAAFLLEMVSYSKESSQNV